MSARSAIVAASLKRGLPLLVVVLGLAVMAPPASAVETHSLEGVVGSGELTAAATLAVGPTGDLYVADTAAKKIFRYDPTGAPAPFAATGSNSLGPFELAPGTQQIAVDDGAKSPNAGDLYVINGTSVFAFDAAGNPAPFSGTAAYIAGNELTGSPAERFSRPSAVAVDSEGDIYVFDGFTAHVFAPTGESLNEFFGFESNTLGIDSNGLAYLGNSRENSFEEEEPSEYPLLPTTTYTYTSGTIAPGASLSVDPGNDQLYLGQASVLQYASHAEGGGLLNEFAGEELAGKRATGLAVDRSGGVNDSDVYVTGGTSVYRFGPLLDLPVVVTNFANEVNPAAGVATLHGTVNPSGKPTTGCVFEYGPTTQYGQTVPCDQGAAEIGEEQTTQPVTGRLTGVAPGTTVHFRLAVSNSEGVSRGRDLVFGPPVVGAQSAEPGTAEVQLAAPINPTGLRTSYSFEYGTTAAYGSATQSAVLAPGLATVRAALGVVGLQPGTTYHYRTVASNEAGTVYGPDATFTTESGASAGGCPNEALRVGPSALLPECRAYEMVSPVDKSGGAVYPNFNVQSSPSGEAIEFLSTSAFAGAPSNNLNAYIANRGDEAWTTAGIDGLQFNSDTLVELTSFATSEDLTKSLQVSFVALAPGAVEGNMNLYLRDDTTGVRTLVATEARNFRKVKLEELLEHGAQNFSGGTANWSRFYFSTTAVLRPGAEAGLKNIYEFSNGQLKLVELPAEGSEPAQPVGGASTTPDGSRVFLQARTGLTYVSENGAAPVLITASQRSGEKGTPVAPNAYEVSANGAFVYFTSSLPLTDDAAAEPQGSLYRYDVKNGTLTDLTTEEDPGVTEIRGVSDDGSWAFVYATGTLSPGSSKASAGTTNAFVWHGAFSFVAESDPNGSESADFNQSQMSPNGRYIAIGSYSELTPAAVPSAACPQQSNINNPPERCRQIFLYDGVAKTLTCASCNGPGAGQSDLPAEASTPAISGHQVRSVLDDGSLFINTPNELVPRDTNGVGDVYRWRDGTATLISTGTSPEVSTLAEASPTGRDIFFRTSQSLVGQDVDARADLYDARYLGGIAAQNPAGAPALCEGEACKGAATSPPPPLASSVHEGRCEAFGGRARKARNEAKRLAKKAASASGKRAKALHRHAAKQRKQAKKLNKKANQCRRQGK
jgi:hypothetical protein